MRVVSIGDLVLDYYYKNDKLIGVNGGMTSHNIIANLAKFKIPTAVFGVCGNDIQGMLAIKSLEDLKVDVSHIKVLDNIETRTFHVSCKENDGKLLFTSKKRCPFCDNKRWYLDSNIDTYEILKNINNDDILIFDNLNSKNCLIIDNTTNIKIIDLGQYLEFEELTSEKIISKLFNKFEIINLNERVFKYLLDRFNLKESVDLFKVLKPKFMTITKGINGVTFIYNNISYDFDLIKTADTLDETGAGDAFLASIIKECINTNFKYDEKLFKKWFENSNKLTAKVVSKIGARGHINTLFKVKKINNNCTCTIFSYKERKKIKRCNININNLETRIINAINSSVYEKMKNINFNGDDNYLFIGTGGSYAGAYFASKVINLMYGSNTYAMYPRDVLYRNNKFINKVLLFSYSGTTNDIINSVKDMNKNDIYVITKGEIQKIVLKTGIMKNNILSYRTSSNKGKERGFLSFEGSVSPAAIFLKYYCNKFIADFDVEKFIRNCCLNWNNYLNEIFLKFDFAKKIKDKGLINIFRGDFTDSACYDLESKFIESGIINCIIHEKKNFSHGRFVNYENLMNNYSIYFKQNKTSKYEEELLDYLGNNNIVIESTYNGILAEFDLLIASQYIIYYFGKYLDIDVSKPKYSNDAMKIYFYKGDL